MIDYMTVDGKIDWSRGFFDREIEKAKTMYDDKGEDFFRHYVSLLHWTSQCCTTHCILS